MAEKHLRRDVERARTARCTFPAAAASSALASPPLSQSRAAVQGVQVKSAKSIRSDGGGGHSTKSVGFQDGQQTPMTSLTSDANLKMKIGRTNPAVSAL